MRQQITKIFEQLGVWFLFSFLPGCIPLLIRLLVYSVHRDKTKIAHLDPIDLLTLGIALNIQSLHEVIKPTWQATAFWKNVSIAINAFLLICFGVLYTTHLLDKSLANQIFIADELMYFTLWITFLSTFFSLAIHLLNRQTP